MRHHISLERFAKQIFAFAFMVAVGALLPNAVQAQNDTPFAAYLNEATPALIKGSTSALKTVVADLQAIYDAAGNE